MTSTNLVIFAFGLLAVSLRPISGAISEEERTKIRASILPAVAECSKEYGIAEDEVKNAKESGNFGSINPCLIGCIMKKSKLINDDGLFDATEAEALAKKYLSDEEDIKKVVDIIGTCKSVNEKEVSDGAKGCDRAKLVFECVLPFKDQFILH